MNPPREPSELPPGREIEVPARPLSSLEGLVGSARFATLQRTAARTGRALRNQTIWNVSSTAAGGGVAEMLRVLVGYVLDAGIDIRWEVMAGDRDFFAVTKRIHNWLHGHRGDGQPIDRRQAAHYRDVTAVNAARLVPRIRPGDVVLLHDPQTAGLAGRLAAHGARVVWRCHVGRETANEWTERGWSFLHAHLTGCEAFVFSLPAFVPSWVDPSRVWIIPPSIDPFSPKNQELTPTTVRRILARLRLLPGGDRRTPTYVRSDGAPGHLAGAATVVSEVETPLRPSLPLVTQVSRWDRLKDMAGVMTGFASGVVGRVDAQLALVGPAVDGVSDDPEEQDVFQDCVARWGSLPPSARQRIVLVTLPMDDVDENAVMVNAIQRHSAVVVQKSLEEGFGLTVAEAMWKRKAVLASRVGGIVPQVPPGTGLLLDDPTDLDGFGAMLVDLLEQPTEIVALGRRAHRHVLDGFIGDVHLIRYAELVTALVSGRRPLDQKARSGPRARRPPPRHPG